MFPLKPIPTPENSSLCVSARSLVLLSDHDCSCQRSLLPSVDLEKKHNLKVDSYILFGDLTEDYSLGISLSDRSEELFQRGKGRVRIYSNCPTYEPSSCELSKM